MRIFPNTAHLKMFLAALMLLIAGFGVAVNASGKKEWPQDPVLQAEIRTRYKI